MTTVVKEAAAVTAEPTIDRNAIRSFVQLVGPLVGTSCAVALGLVGTAYLTLIAALDSNRLATVGAVYGVLYFVCAVVAFVRAVHTARAEL